MPFLAMSIPDAPSVPANSAPALMPTVSEFEFFPRAPSSVGRVDVACADIDANDVIPPAGGIGLHVPTLARAFRDRLRDCSNSATFQKELQLLWQNIFHVPSDLSPRPELLMVHWAAFEFAVNEIVLACEESRYMESIPVAENKALVPLEFLKQDPSFCAFISIQLRLEAPVSSVRLPIIPEFIFCVSQHSFR